MSETRVRCWKCSHWVLQKFIRNVSVSMSTKAIDLLNIKEVPFCVDCYKKALENDKRLEDKLYELEQEYETKDHEESATQESSSGT